MIFKPSDIVVWEGVIASYHVIKDFVHINDDIRLAVADEVKHYHRRKNVK